MIQITDKHNCCGCSACVQRCPKQCITMQEDNEGFFYPIVDETSCIECRLCETVCPVLNQVGERKPMTCYAAKNIDDAVRFKSSSGGVFMPLAVTVIEKGGVVFGACYNYLWEVEHVAVTKVEELDVLRGSKYVQSKIGGTFKEVEAYLKDGRDVLFSGTPCQVAGLKKYLRKDFDNLITIDVVCHGVPSPMVWRDYISQLPTDKITEICMKDKSTGWRNYSFSLRDKDNNTILSEKASYNKYLLAFIRNLTVRPSCFVCPAKAGKSCSDITLADLWGIEKIIPEMDDNMGASFVCCNTEKGDRMLKSINIDIAAIDYDTTVPFNPCIYKSTSEPSERVAFWNKYERKGILALSSIKKSRPSIIKRMFRRIIR